MSKRTVIIGILIGLALAFAVFFLSSSKPVSISKDLTQTPGSKTSEDSKPKEDLIKSVFKGKDTFSVLLIGIDRRKKTQLGFNTDVMILASVNTKTNRVLLTSVPRDLWINDNKINALWTVSGWETLKDAFEKITGQTVDGYIMCDFEDFRWIVDSFGSVPVEVERTFTDNQFPNDSDTAVLSVTFTKGEEKMTGARALTFARSRKGDNGEGSDLMRAKRQHLILKGMVKAISQPESIFWPMDVEKFFGAVTTVNRMRTTLTLDDAYYLWDFYKDREKYNIESFVIDGTYVYHPGMYPQSPYHAWVFIPRDGALPKLHEDIKAKLEGTFVDPSAKPENTTQPTGTTTTQTN